MNENGSTSREHERRRRKAADYLASRRKESLERPLDADWWIKGWIEREQITGIAPEPFLLRKDEAELDAVLDSKVFEGDVRATLEAFNARIVAARRQLLGGPPVVTPIRDIDREVERWAGRRAARLPSVPPNPLPRQRWWHRLLRGGG